MESLRKNLSAYTLDDAPEDVRELYKDEFIQLYVHIPADTRSAFPVISVHSPVSIQYRWQS